MKQGKELEADPCAVCGNYPYRNLNAAGYWDMHSGCEHREDIICCHSEEELVWKWNTGKGGHYHCDKHGEDVVYQHTYMGEGFSCGCFKARWVEQN